MKIQPPNEPHGRTGFRSKLALFGCVVLVLVCVATIKYVQIDDMPLSFVLPASLEATLLRSTAPKAMTSPFRYTFNANGILNESGDMDTSSSPYFWLNSGGRLYIKDGIGQTVQGPLKKGIFWQLLYAKNNSLDTGGGLYPQNLFRLLTRSKWSNVSQEVRFNITNLNLTDTPNRDSWSGVFLMSRYQDSDNLYYAGVRQDGSLVIKLKQGGTYTTLSQSAFIATTTSYNRDRNPNFVPEDRWLRLKSDTVTKSDGTVEITLWFDENDDGSYEHTLQASDRTHAGEGYAGIRTDYFDVLFDDYTLRSIKP